MTVLGPQTGEIPIPYPSALSEPYWDGCARHELLFQRCESCGHATHTPAVICAHCTSQDLAWEASAGKGSIYTWTTVWRPQIPTFEVPYVAIIVDMDEGWQVLSNLIGCPADAVHIGMRVEVEFHEIQGDFTLPYFRPAAEG
jgi:uncharacterized OB-fold protein